MALQEDPFVQLVALVDQLVENASQLSNLAKEGCSEKELNPLQERQEELVSGLRALDALIKTKKEPLPQEIKEKVEKRLALFEKLNQEFVAHLECQFRIIQKKKQV